MFKAHEAHQFGNLACEHRIPAGLPGCEAPARWVSLACVQQALVLHADLHSKSALGQTTPFRLAKLAMHEQWRPTSCISSKSCQVSQQDKAPQAPKNQVPCESGHHGTGGKSAGQLLCGPHHSSPQATLPSPRPTLSCQVPQAPRQSAAWQQLPCTSKQSSVSSGSPTKPMQSSPCQLLGRSALCTAHSSAQLACAAQPGSLQALFLQA